MNRQAAGDKGKVTENLQNFVIIRFFEQHFNFDLFKHFQVLNLFLSYNVIHVILNQGSRYRDFLIPSNLVVENMDTS